jgi:D-serine deaminase-like pyridoxal phosphate-dependent protein
LSLGGGVSRGGAAVEAVVGPVEGTAVDPTRVETPVGCIDLRRVAANAERVAAYAGEHGLHWRPHVKTHKSITVAKIQLRAGARGLTVATLREAEVMASLTNDILFAYPPVGEAKLARLMALPPALDLKVALDAPDVLDELAGAARAAGRSVGVLVELDVGLGRVGLQTSADVLTLARTASELEGVDFRGVIFYPGHIRMAEAEQREPLADVSERVAATLRVLEVGGLSAQIVSGGSTPTLWRSHEVAGLTEIRSGSCIFNDREALDIGVAGIDDVAYTVLATVVSTAVPCRAVVDAGSKALAKESRGSGGFGMLLDHPEVTLVGLSEEHGVLDTTSSGWRPRVGDRVRIVPNHVCVSVNLQDHLLGFDGEAYRVVALEGRGRGPWTG